MKKTFVTAALCLTLLSAGAASANGLLTRPNGTMGTMMTPDGAVVMAVQVPPKEFAAMTAMMAAKHATCTMFNANANDGRDAVILVCGPTRDYNRSF